jgi:preprotein translocase subunit SecD
VSAAASGRSGTFGLAGLSLWCAIVAASLWSIAIAAAEPLLLEVARAETGFDRRSNEPIVSLKLSEKSARLLAQLTQENVGRPMHLRVDGKIVMSPVIREPILHGSLQISGRFSAKEAKDIADSIRSGSKVEVELVSQ